MTERCNLLELLELFESNKCSSYTIQGSSIKAMFKHAGVKFKPDDVYFKNDDGCFFCIRNVRKIYKTNSMITIIDHNDNEYMVIMK